MSSVKQASCNICNKKDNEFMVQCDGCDAWFHFVCVGVDMSIEEKPWSCTTCTATRHNSLIDKGTLPNKSPTKSRTSSTISNTKREILLKRLEEEHQLDLEEGSLKLKLKKAYLNKKYAILSQMESDNESVGDVDSTIKSARLCRDWIDNSVPTSNVTTQPVTKTSDVVLPITSILSKTTQAIIKPAETNNTQVDCGLIPTAIPGESISANINPSRTSNVYASIFNPTRITGDDGQPKQAALSSQGLYPNNMGYSQIKNEYEKNEYMFPQPTKSNNYTFDQLKQNRNPLSEFNIIQNQKPLTTNQLAARQALDKDLPIFSGKPEDWPLFYSSYEMSTNLCGFTNPENLIRLQKCLKGRAKDAVKSRLLLPSAVPDIINTLRMLYGKPEAIIHSLLQKVRSQPLIRTERPEQIIEFALEVQNMTDTMRACNMHNHLTNPLVLQELVNKLSFNLKFSWATNQRTILEPNLIHFTEWLSDIAHCISDVTILDTRDTAAERYSKTNSRNVNTHSIVNNKKCIICQNNCPNVSRCNKFKNLTREAKWTTVREHRLCRTCLKLHQNIRCNSTVLCNINNCRFRHHPLLHNPLKGQSRSEINTATTSLLANTSNSNCNTHLRNKEEILFRIIPIKIFNKQNFIETFAFLDEGSSITIMESALAKELNLKGTPETLCLKWTSDTVRTEKDSERVSFQISGQNNASKKYKVSDARTVEKLSLPLQTVIASDLKQKYPHLKNIPFTGYENAKPRILIGLDNYKLTLPLEHAEEKISHIVATRSRLGWSVHGSPSKSEQVYFHHLHICDCKTDETLHNIIKEYFTTESFGVKAPVSLPESTEDMRAKLILRTTTKKIENRFETGLLWKDYEFKIPDSFPTAKRRLLCLEKKMQMNPDLYKGMKQTINDYVVKGYAKKLQTNEMKTDYPVWYLPIFAVRNPNKPEKFRMVFDAAAKTDGISLNMMLTSGPDLLQPLQAVLLKFREHKVAICGDIKEMFHQVKIREEDQHVQRFLWRESNTDQIDIYIMQVMTFGATCSPCSAQYVKNNNAEMFADTFPEASKAIIQNHYVDDLLLAVDTEEEAVKIVNEIKYIHQKAGFEIRNWISNSSKVLKELNEHRTCQKKKHFVEKNTELQSERVLGMWWNVNEDVFTYSLKFNKSNNEILTGIQTPTKRQVLRTLMSIFDPLGFLAPVLICAKILLQNIWQSKVDWDECITDGQNRQWQLWVRELTGIQKTNIPRCYSLHVKNSSNIQLHTFVDASESAFAAVTYLRIETGQNIECTIVSAKSRIAPKNPLSIPRMELQAAVLGVRLTNTMLSHHTLPISKKVLWTDSKTVLHWICNSNPRRFKQFVSHRIGEILESTSFSNWRWVPSAENPADDATKRTKMSKLTNDSRWFKGPEFLRKDETEWPICNISLEQMSNNDEIRKEIVNIIQKYEPLLKYQRFSKWERLIRTVAYVERAIKIFKNSSTLGLSNELSSIELRSAELTIYKQIQLESYPEEVNGFNSENNYRIKDNSLIYKISPYLDQNGLLRVRGRIDAARDIYFDAKRPIILPRNHYVTTLIVDYYHRRFHHWNNETVINELRQKYNISKLRVLLKTIRHNYCQKCKNSKAKPTPPEMGNLPASRLSSFTRPFSYVGIDYFGPMNVIVGRRTEKRWGMLITCLTVRAIHIEVVHSLTTDSCIMGLRNFIARRGEPIEIWSDNGTNFKGAANELALERQKINDQTLYQTFVSATTTWRFIPPSSPHMGGAWERLVRSVKQILNQVMPTRNPFDELLRCILLEAEKVINSRPLTYIPLETEEEEALTPNHFILGSSSGTKPIAEFPKNVLMLRKNWHKAQYVADQFWRRWVKEYLPDLTRRTKWFQYVKPVEVGDIVIIVDERNARGSWPKGIVIKTIVGSGNQVRAAEVKTSTGTLVRPAAKLAILDVRKE